MKAHQRGQHYSLTCVTSSMYYLRQEECMGKKKVWTASEMGKKGGPARKKALSKERRSEIARKAALAKWKKRK